MCGENIPLGTPLDCVQGSSPRVRGKLPNRVHPTDLKGLIPAHAGKTYGCRTRGRRLRAHPRACGENFEATRREVAEKGSSPRMRGKQSRRGPRNRIRGLIPAHAGKTFSLLGTSPRLRAHPRACGENFEATRREVAEKGSSPRMRGKQMVRGYKYSKVRLIPAHAGKTRSFR